jgi:hypothetical protein
MRQCSHRVRLAATDTRQIPWHMWMPGISLANVGTLPLPTSCGMQAPKEQSIAEVALPCIDTSCSLWCGTHKLLRANAAAHSHTCNNHAPSAIAQRAVVHDMNVGACRGKSGMKGLSTACMRTACMTMQRHYVPSAAAEAVLQDQVWPV